MGQYRTNFSDTLRFFKWQTDTESFHKKTVKEYKWYIIYLFIYFWDGARAGDWIYACPLVSALVMIQMLHKDTAGRKSKFLKSNLLIPSNSHCPLDTFCCLYVSQKTLCHQLRFLDTRECSENVLLMSLKHSIISVVYTKDRRTMFWKCSLYVAKNIISSVYPTQQTQRQCSEKQEERKLINCGSNDPCLPFYPIRCRQKWTLFHCQEVDLK